MDEQKRSFPLKKNLIGICKQSREHLRFLMEMREIRNRAAVITSISQDLQPETFVSLMYHKKKRTED